MTIYKKITRGELIEIAERALTAAEAEHRISGRLRADIMRVAQTADKVSIAWWHPEAGCGCLVGTERHLRGLAPEPLVEGWEATRSVSEEVVGYTFVRAVRDVIGTTRHIIDVLEVEG